MNLMHCEVLGSEWFALTRHYETEAKSRRAFDRLMHAGMRREGELNVGCYRHGYPEDPKQLYITVVGMDADTVEFCGHMLAGEEYEMEGELLTSLVFRRIRKLGELAEKRSGSGVYHYPHPEGMKLDDLGRER